MLKECDTKDVGDEGNKHNHFSDWVLSETATNTDFGPPANILPLQMHNAIASPIIYLIDSRDTIDIFVTFLLSNLVRGAHSEPKVAGCLESLSITLIDCV